VKLFVFRVTNTISFEVGITRIWDYAGRMGALCTLFNIYSSRANITNESFDSSRLRVSVIYSRCIYLSLRSPKCRESTSTLTPLKRCRVHSFYNYNRLITKPTDSTAFHMQEIDCKLPSQWIGQEVSHRCIIFTLILSVARMKA
jgi:hypothetical protein